MKYQLSNGHSVCNLFTERTAIICQFALSFCVDSHQKCSLNFQFQSLASIQITFWNTYIEHLNVRVSSLLSLFLKQSRYFGIITRNCNFMLRKLVMHYEVRVFKYTHGLRGGRDVNLKALIQFISHSSLKE